MKTASLFALCGFIFSAFILLCSYFFTTALLFPLGIFLIIVLFINAFAIFSQRPSVDFDIVTIFLFINTFATFFITTNLLGDYQIEKEGLSYIITSKSTYIGVATLEEYQLYRSRISRLVAAYLLFFFHILYKTSVHALSIEEKT